MISDELQRLRLISGAAVSAIFDEIYSDILTISYESESVLFSELWRRYDNRNNNLNGSVFEGILAVIFYRSNILPLYIQAKMAFVPNVDFDFIAYTKEYGPVILSAKTSLRERYKQADLEGMMLRQVHRKSLSYLITINESEANRVNEKIALGQVLGIEEVVVADTSRFDGLIRELQELNYYQPEKVDVITSNRIITA
jgi:hypothetical protein